MLSEGGCNSIFIGSRGGTGGVLAGTDGITRGARPDGRSIEEARRCDLSSQVGVLSAGSISCLASES